MLRRRLTTGLAAAGLSGAMAAAATAQDPSVTPTPIETATPTPSPTPTVTPSPSPSPTGTPESLGTFTVDLPADTPTPRPTATAVPRRDRAAAKRIARQTGAKPKATPSPTPTPTPAADSGVVPGDVAMPDWDQLPAAQVSAASLHAFRIPPFLLPIYQAAGVQYGVRWEVLAAINEVETDYGRNLNVSSAGALGWMQFMPASWKAWGVDANGDGVKDPFNPVDAIFAAARYLRAAGAGTNLRRAIFAYNHADWYVDDVLRRAQAVAALPTPLVGALTGLAQGRFPVAGPARYPAVRHSLHGLRLITHPGAAVVATTDGRVLDFGSDARRGRYIVLADAYGNRYTYAHLGRVAATYPVVRSRPVADVRAPRVDPEPEAPASVTRHGATAAGPPAAKAGRHAAHHEATPRGPLPDVRSEARPTKARLFAHPARKAARHHGGPEQLAESRYRPLPGATLKLDRRNFTAQSMHRGARVLAGTILGRSTRSLLFEIQPAGKGAPRIDPKPILDGWRLLQSTALYHHTDGAASLGQVLLMGKGELQREVLADPNVSIYPCGRRDIRLGLIDRRVLATLEFLAASNLDPTVSALECGHSYLTTSGNVSEHSSGSAVDIAAINGTPILGHQGPGSITETTINRLLTLQGPLQPHQIISLMPYDDSPTAFALPDHADHIHVGFHPEATWAGGLNGSPSLSGGQWPALVKRIGEIQQPTVRTTPSRYSLRVRSN